MAILRLDGHELEVPNGTPIIDIVENLGVPFGCRKGYCATCVIQVKEGEENLNSMLQVERDLGLSEESGERLACQCILREGNVDIEF